ncbi:MAG: DUF3000 domain-containing protein [Aeromicrobium erythreum]
MGARSEFDHTPPAFTAALEQLLAAPVRPEVVVDEIPAPQRIAPFAHALSGDLEVGGDDVATGRFILLHDPAGNDAWDGTFRCVTFARAEVEREMAEDPALATVGWSWLVDALEAQGGTHTAASGSVTVVSTETFGEMAGDTGSAQVEIRASWTPTSEAGAHVAAWTELLCTLAGLPPLAPGVVPLQRRRGRR